VLESPAGQRRRIDVETGLTVFEVKRDLRVGNVRAEAVEQLARYVTDRTETMQQRYVGVLTDGAEWHLYHLVDGALVPVSRPFLVDPATPDVESLCVWLEGVLATAEQITPTPLEIARRLGADSPAHALNTFDLTTLYELHHDRPAVKLKRELWAKLLTTALGTAFADEDRLFVEHTLLVTSAEIISHAVVGIDPADPLVPAASLVQGALFAQAQIAGVVEPDFFDWVVEVPGGDRFVKALARRLSRFAWGQVEHDVMKVLYESVISAEQRHRLGEYYTPDWLADEIVSAAVTDPLEQRVLDPGCGSGTFLFHVVRRYLKAAEDGGIGNPDAILGVTAHVMGVDVHPVAVTLARVTYLLAIGLERLQAADRPAFAVPVYLGDSVQWGQERTLFSAEALTVPTDDGAQLFADELRFPERLLADAGRFDRLVAELADKATRRERGSPFPSLAATFRLFAVHPDDQEVLTRTFETVCGLHDDDRNHIWGYYVRNLARPVWLSQPANRVDVLVGNPPWLAYRYMTAPMQEAFRVMSQELRLWAGATVATHQDLSALFVVRCVGQYLREGGRFGFVMPLAALSRRQFAGFRAGDHPAPAEPVRVAFGRPWDLHRVKPSFFPVPASVVFGERTARSSVPLSQPPELWSGRLPLPNASRSVAMQSLTRTTAARRAEHMAGSAYGPRFANGATVFPRLLFVVEEAHRSALGTGAGRRAVHSERSPNEKRPWRDLPPLEGVVESQFVRQLYLGDSILPFRSPTPRLAVIPLDGQTLLDGGSERLDYYPGLAAWWRQAEVLWSAYRSSERLSLAERLDYRHGLTQQFPAPAHRVVYSKAGMYMAATRVSDPAAVIENTLYWAAVADIDEARYLTAILNSGALTELVRPLQARGEHNPRHFDKYIFQIPIPLYDSGDHRHLQLVDLAAVAERVAGDVELSDGVSFQALRRRIRFALSESGIAEGIDALVSSLVSVS
jgi:SAM-dependent methyltransferase